MGAKKVTDTLSWSEGHSKETASFLTPPKGGLETYDSQLQKS